MNPVPKQPPSVVISLRPPRLCSSLWIVNDALAASDLRSFS